MLCDRKIQPIKKFGWGSFILLAILFLPLAVFPLLSYVFKKPNICPICKTDQLV